MYILQKVVGVVLIIFCMSEASQDVYSEGIDMTWSQNHTEEYKKTRTYEKPMHEIFVGDEYHSLVLLTCESMFEKQPKKCELTIRTHHFNNKIVTKICKIHPPIDEAIDEVKIDRVTFLRIDRVLVSWKQLHKKHGWRMAFSVVSAESGKESDFIYVHIDDRHYLPVDYIKTNYWIVRFKNFFDIIFDDFKSCLDRSHYCKITYSYDGEPVNSVPSPFSPLYLSANSYNTIEEVHAMNFGSEEGMVVMNMVNYWTILRNKDVYSPIMDWANINVLSHGKHIYSNSSRFASICWIPFRNKNELHCKWLDGTHGNNTLILTGEHDYGQMPKIYNAPSGNIVLIAHANTRSGGQNILIDEAGMDGQCKRFAIISESEIHDFDYMRFSMPDYNRFCFSSVSWRCRNGSISDCRDEMFFRYRFLTRCVKINPNNYKLVKCAYGYYGLVSEAED